MRLPELKNLELRWRLSLVIGLLLTATMSVGAAIAVSDARVAVGDEVNASLRAATANLDVTLALLRGRPASEVESALQLWSATYTDGRHLCVALDRPSQPSMRCHQVTDVSKVPAWFSRGAEVIEPAVVHEVALEGGVLRVHLVPDPGDELREAWSDVRNLLLLIGLLAFSVNLCIFLALSHGLKPLRQLMLAMDQIGRGLPMPALSDRGAFEMRTLLQGLRELSQRLVQGREALNALHLRNLELQEDERRFVARELHDEIGQHVTAIEMEVIRIGHLDPADLPQRQERLAQIRESVSQVHRVSRRLAHRLKPPAIDRLGLAGSIRSMTERWREDLHGVELHLDLDAACDRIPDELAVHVYRIVQESLSNATRHAQAGNVWVRVALQGAVVIVRIHDDGRGFDAASSTAGFGLAGMRERAQALSGRFNVESAADQGTMIEAIIPLAMHA